LLPGGKARLLARGSDRVDLRVGSDRNQFERFLRAVAGTVPVVEREAFGEPPSWRYSWREGQPDGTSIRVQAEVDRYGWIQFSVQPSGAEAQVVPSTVYPYSLAWGQSVTYARSMIDAAKSRAPAPVPLAEPEPQAGAAAERASEESSRPLEESDSQRA
jgi:hypothetical protein